VEGNVGDDVLIELIARSSLACACPLLLLAQCVAVDFGRWYLPLSVARQPRVPVGDVVILAVPRSAVAILLQHLGETNWNLGYGPI
jgi:hypothetical protein